MAEAKGATAAVSRLAKVTSAAGVLAAVIVALLANILAARHYERWDVTSARLYTLSPATIETLRGLEQNVHIDVLLSGSDPLERSVRNILEKYRAVTTRLDVAFVDPDRHPAEFVAVQQKYDIVAGRTEGGRVVTDASIVVSSGDRHWFVTSTDLVDYSGDEEGTVTTRLEQSLTAAIRAVLAGERTQVCFTWGHGEFSLDDNADQGLSELKQRLEKDNYEVVSVDTTRDDAASRLPSCSVLLVVGPSVPFTPQEAERIQTRINNGMSAALFVNPMLDATQRRMLATGLEPVTHAFGIGIANDFVFERNDNARLPRGAGEVFFPEIKPHPITEGLISAAQAGVRVVLMRARSLHDVRAEAKPAILLMSSPEAFGMRDFFAWVERGGDPAKQDGDTTGPLPLGMAAEKSDSAGSSPRKARLVVLGTANPVLNHNWRDPGLRGNAILTGNIVSWLADRAPIVDVPARQAVTSDLRITENSLGEILRYVMIYMPAATALLGLAVFLRRRSSPRTRRQPAKS